MKQQANSEVTDVFDAKRQWHRDQARLPLRRKFEILIQLQADEMPLLKRQREMKSWEKPWAVEP